MSLSRKIISIYRKLPIQLFKGTLLRIYSAYRMINRHKTVIATIDGITYELDLNQSVDSLYIMSVVMNRM